MNAHQHRSMWRCLSLLPLCLSSIMPGSSLQAAVHTQGIVVQIANPDDRPCIFFRLSGVAEADPVLPGQPWFAVPKTHGGYKEIVATLMIARSTQDPIYQVLTSGAVACGYAEVLSIAW